MTAGDAGRSVGSARHDGEPLVDYFNLTLGSSRQIAGAVHIVSPMSTDMAISVPFAAVKEVATQPVLAVGRINHPGLDDVLLAEGLADLCGMTRAMICDPDLANETKAGAVEEIRQCIACNQGMSPRGSEPVLRYRHAHQIRPEFQFRVSWSPQQLVLWHNRAVLHYAMNDYPGHRRHLRRVTALER